MSPILARRLALTAILAVIGSVVLSAIMPPTILGTLAQVGWGIASAFIAAELIRR